MQYRCTTTRQELGFSAKLGSTKGWVWRSGRSKSRIKSTFFVPFWEKAPSAIRWRAGLRSVEATSRVERANLRRENIYEHCQREREREPPTRLQRRDATQTRQDLPRRSGEKLFDCRRRLRRFRALCCNGKASEA